MYDELGGRRGKAQDEFPLTVLGMEPSENNKTHRAGDLNYKIGVAGLFCQLSAAFSPEVISDWEWVSSTKRDAVR